MKGNAELKAQKVALDEANLLVETARQRIKDLEAKKAALANGGGDGADVKSAETKKRGVLARFILGAASKEELNGARNAFERARRSEEETREMIEAIDASIDETREEMPRLENALRAAGDALWRGIADDLKKKAIKAADDLIAKAYAAEPYVGRFDLWLAGVFKDAGTATYGAGSNALRKQVEKEYLGE